MGRLDNQVAIVTGAGAGIDLTKLTDLVADGAMPFTELQKRRAAADLGVDGPVSGTVDDQVAEWD